MTKQELQHNILSKPYNREVWNMVLKRVFGATKLHLQPPSILLAANEIADTAVELGSFYTKDERLIGIYEINIKPDASTNITINKAGLRNLLRSIYKYDVDGALIVFVQNNKWRFSYVSEIRTQEGKKETEPKRYTYLFGDGEVCRTASERFYKLIDKKYYLQDLYDAFSVEKLNKDFFTTYKEFYKKGIEHLINNKKHYDLLYDRNKEYKEQPDLQQKPIRDFVKKLLGRIVFLHFLQKKEWLGCPILKTKKENKDIWQNGSRTFMQDLYKQFQNKEHFHSQCLSVLFLQTLNTERENSIFEIELSSKAVRVPYLNGGLFDTEKIDKKTGKPIEELIDFPADFFDKLLDFFEQYNFTIDENDPYDNEVGIDPEMLGHIFENLLEDNKDRGAFYTPKEIVHYMCQESLIEYIKTNSKILKHKSEEDCYQPIENFVRNHKVDDTLSTKENAIALNNLLANIKICDPAIGSGAFPMGMLKELLECRRHIYPFLKTNEDFKPNLLKKQIIENNIYGVDIEAGAVDIARLRFWLALVVDELKPEPLPNLDYKIMQGNSLLEQFEGIDLKFEKMKFEVTLVKEVDLFGNIIKPQTSITEFLQTKQSTKEFNITELEHTFFNSTNPAEKKEIKEKIQQFEKEFIKQETEKKLAHYDAETKHLSQKLNQLLENKNDSKAINKAQQTKNDNAVKALEKKQLEIDKLKLAKQDLKDKVAELFDEQNTNNKPYFLWHLYFTDVFSNGGFDIVIGNPPYIQLQKIQTEAKALEKAKYQTFAKTGDIYCLFYEQGFNLLKPNGVLTYITSNSWMKTKYGELLRNYFTEHTNPITLINFEDSKIFQTATVETNILIGKREKYNNFTNAVAVKQDYNLSSSILDYKNNNQIELVGLSNTEWNILSKNDFLIIKEIEKDNSKISDFDLNINIGINTGLNEVFIIDDDLKNQFIKNDKKNAEILKPILRGRDLKKYSCVFANKWLINAHNGIRSKEIQPVNVENEYPIIFEYLNDHKIKLSARWDQGLNWYNLRNCAYLEDFSKPKIIWGELSDKAKFVYDENAYFTNNTIFLMTGNNLKFILTILNSKAGEFYFNMISTTSGMGTNRWLKYKIEQLPIPKMPEQKVLQKFETLADYLIFLNDATNPAINPYSDNASLAPVFEDVANMMVYELYFTEHMKELDLDVLNEKEFDKYFMPIDTINDANKKAEIIGTCYNWLQEQSNPIRNKIILSNVKSKDIIRRINATTH